MDPETNFKCGAYTHAASRLMPGGRTLEHIRRSYARACPPKTVLAIDEINMVPLSTLTVLARFAHLGCRFVLMGDFEGQELPIFDGWPTARIGDTDLNRQMSRSLWITLSENRRCADDKPHFQNYCGLYNRIDDKSCIDEARLRCAWNGDCLLYTSDAADE